MRVKAKHTLGLHANGAAGLIEEAAPVAGAAPLPYRLVPPASNDAPAVPAVLVASNARVRPGKALLPADLAQLAQGLLSQQSSSVGHPDTSGAAVVAAQRPQQPGQGKAVQQAAGTAGRPVRKRKQTAYSEDMIPSDLLMARRGTKAARAAAGPAAQLLQRPPLPAALTLPPAALAASPGAMATAAAPGAAGLPAAIQLVSMPTVGGGSVPALAVPAAALLAMPAFLQQHQQLLRVQGGSVTAGVQLVPSSQLHHPAAAAAMPYRLVPAVQPTNGKAAAAQPPPVVRLAAPRDIVHVAKQLDEEERKKVLAASDARVVLRVLPGTQAAGGRGMRGGLGGKPQTGRAGSMAGRGHGGRGSGRSSRRATPEPRLDGLSPGTWHPGFECFDGVTYVDVLQSTTAPPLPAVVVGEPPRLSQSLVAADMPEFGFSEDPLRSSLDFLRDAARTGGQQAQYSGTVQAAVNAEKRLYKERLARAHFARDRRRFAKERMEGTRKSVRTRNAPDVFVLPDVPLQAEQAAAARASGGRPRPPRPPPRPEDETDVRLGADFQVALPALRPRPPAPSADEERWIAGLVCSMADVPPPPAPQYAAQQVAAMPAASCEERVATVAAAHGQLKNALGEERAAALGLLSMGCSAFRGLLDDSEEAALEAGMREFGRAFHTIAAEQLPGRSAFDLQNYYYNVWKLRCTPRSRAWYEEKVAEEAARLAELERQERAAAEEQEAQRQRQEARYKRRMLREVVQWVKTAARAPGELQNRPTVVQRAQRAAKLIGGMNAEPAGMPAEVPAS